MKEQLRKLTIFQRIFLSVCLFLLPLAVLFYFALAQVADNVEFGRKELAGLRFQRPLIELVKASGDVSAIVNSITAVIEQQSTAAKDITRSVSETSSGVADAYIRMAETLQATREIARDGPFPFVTY